MDFLTDNKGDFYWLLQIPGDGNCLFGAIVHQLFGIVPSHDLFCSYSRQLRVAAVDEIRENLEFYTGHLITFAEDFVLENVPIDVKIRRYLDALWSDGFWGGAESVAAICNHHQISIVVHQDNGKIEFVPTRSEHQEWPVYNIFYRGMHDGVRTHYDSVLCFRPRELPAFSNAGFQSNTVLLFDVSIAATVVSVGDTNQSIFSSLHHQLTRVPPTEESLNIYRGLIASELETQPNLLELCGIDCKQEDLASYLFRLRIGHHDAGLAALSLMASLFRITIFIHSDVKETRRLDPMGLASVASVHILEEDRGDCNVYSSVVSLERLRPSVSAQLRRKPPPDHLLIASKVSRYEQSASQETVEVEVFVDASRGLRLASLNVHGCRMKSKQEAIDNYFLSQNVHVACLQEVNLDCLQLISSNYRWYMGAASGSRKRGLAILVRLGLDAQIEAIRDYGFSIQYVELVYKVENISRSLQIVNVHGPNQNSDVFFSDLGRLVSNLSSSRRVIIVGDFNCHLSNRGLTFSESALIGKHAGHDNFNDNGMQMRKKDISLKLQNITQ